MSQDDEQQPEQQRYVRRLEELVKARTDQLVQAVSQSDQLLKLLTRIQSMESLEQVREATQAGIRKFTPEPAPAPRFGGDAGEPVPSVDPEDLKAIWLMGKEMQAAFPQSKAVGMDVMRSYCKPGANLEATGYRSSMIWLLSQVAQQQLTPYFDDETEYADPVFATMASLPMTWVGPGPKQDLPFDIKEFFRRLNEN